MSNDEISLIFALSYTFAQSIERIWYVMKNFSLIEILKQEALFPIKISSENKERFKLNSIVNGKFYNNIPFTGTIIKSITLPHKKTITTLLKFGKENQIISKIALYKITQNNKCLITWVIKYKDKESKDIVNLDNYQSNWTILMKKIEKILNETSLNLFQFEGCVITANMNDIWNYCLDFSKLKKIAPLLPIEQDKENIEIKKGETYTMKNCKKNGFYNIKIIELERKKSSNKWKLTFEAFDGIPKIPYQKVSIRLTKVNYSDCQLVINHEFKEPVEQKIISELCKEKRYLLHCLKDYLENFKQ